LWRIDPLLGNARNTHAANNTGTVFLWSSHGPLLCSAHKARSRVRGNVTQKWRGCVFCCGPFQVIVRNNRMCFLCGPRMPSAGKRANRHTFWNVTCVFCAPWSVSRLYKGTSLKNRRVKRMGIQRRTTEYNRMRTELSIGS
jgi:hypothetical protein